MSSELNDLDIIREKRKKEQDGKKENDWGSFAVSLLTGFILIVIWAIIGSNLLYLVRYVNKGSNTFGNFFPDNAKDAPYFPASGSAPPQRGNLFSYLTTTLSDVQANLKKGDTGKVPAPKQLPPKIPSFKRKPQQELEMQELRKMSGGAINPKLAEMFEKMSGLSKYSFPYNWKSSEEGLLGDFKAWIANSVEFSYINGRSGINELLSILNTVENGVGSWSIFLLSLPVILLILLLTQFYGFFSTLIGEVIGPNKGWIWAIIFFFVLGFDFILAFIVTIVQTIQNIFTFLFVPAFLDWNSISQILVEHTTLLTTVFGLYVISSAYANLDTLMGSTMLLTFIGLMVYNWKKKTNVSQ